MEEFAVVGGFGVALDEDRALLSWHAGGCVRTPMHGATARPNLRLQPHG